MTLPQSDQPWLAPSAPDLVWFGGADATRFLNDLISQELGDMADGDSRRSFLLGPQGKLQFILWVIRRDGRWGLVTEPGRGEELAAALNRYRIRVDVDIQPEENEVWLVIGEWDDGFDVSWAGRPRSLVLGDQPPLEVGSEEWAEQARIQAGEPKWGVDVDDRTIPAASGLVSVSVDFDKGCFLGQELVARIDSRGGNVPHRLRHIEDSTGSLRAGAVLKVEGREVGTVTSASDGALGLAMIHRDVGIGDQIEADGEPVVVKSLPIESRG